MVYASYVGSYASLYPGLKEDYGELFSGYRLAAKRIGAATSFQTANQIAEVSARLSEGMSTIELQPASAQLFESIPKQQFKEINRLSKLTGAEISLHTAYSPTLDPAGFTEGGWNEAAREEAERRMLNIVEKGHELNPKGNVPVTFHASAISAAEWRPGVPGEREMIAVVNPASGETGYIKRESSFDPETNKMKEYLPEEMLEINNQSHWKREMMNMQFYKKDADELLERSWQVIGPVWKDIVNEEGKLVNEEIKKLSEAQKLALNEVINAQSFYQNIDAMFRGAYDEAYKYTPAQEKEKVIKRLGEIAEERKKIVEGPPSLLRAGYDHLINELKELPPPQHLLPVEEFAKEKAATTLGNVAFKAYKKYGENTPIVSVENVYPNMAFSRAEQLKGLIEESRRKFVENAVKEGISESKAKADAEKLIGATWDIGHINMLRKYGYKEEEIIKETKKIAPYVKHVHITDNFGFDDTHLPPGMGNVPVKKLMEKMEKAGYSSKAIIEAGPFAANFKTSPHPYALEALGSPIYYEAAAPLWGQVKGMYGTYFTGYGNFLPEQHFSMYGGGFSALPSELGGGVPGKGSRFSGTPME